MISYFLKLSDVLFRADTNFYRIRSANVQKIIYLFFNY